MIELAQPAVTMDYRTPHQPGIRLFDSPQRGQQGNSRPARSVRFSIASSAASVVDSVYKALTSPFRALRNRIASADENDAAMQIERGEMPPPQTHAGAGAGAAGAGHGPATAAALAAATSAQAGGQNPATHDPQHVQPAAAPAQQRPAPAVATVTNPPVDPVAANGAATAADGARLEWGTLAQLQAHGAAQAQLNATLTTLTGYISSLTVDKQVRLTDTEWDAVRRLQQQGGSFVPARVWVSLVQAKPSPTHNQLQQIAFLSQSQARQGAAKARISPPASWRVNDLGKVDVDSFLSQWHLYCVLTQQEVVSALIQMAPDSTRATVISIAAAVVSAGLELTFERAAVIFKYAVGADLFDAAHSAREKLAKRAVRQRDGQPVVEYGMQLRTLAQAAGATVHPSAVCAAFVEGMVPALARECISQPDGTHWQDLEVCLQFAVGKERALALNSRPRDARAAPMHVTPTPATDTSHAPEPVLAAAHTPWARDRGRGRHTTPSNMGNRQQPQGGQQRAGAAGHGGRGGASGSSGGGNTRGQQADGRGDFGGRGSFGGGRGMGQQSDRFRHGQGRPPPPPPQYQQYHQEFPPHEHGWDEGYGHGGPQRGHGGGYGQRGRGGYHPYH